MFTFGPSSRGVSIDSLFASVALLLKGNGANNGTVFTDSSLNNWSQNAASSVITSDAQSQFDGSSIFFQDVDNTVLQYPASTLYNNGASFTLEFWIRLGALPIGDTYFMGTSNTRYFDLTAGGVMSSTALGGNNMSFGALSINTWHWITLVYDSTLPRTSAYLNGTRASTGTDAASANLSSNEKWGVGNCPDIAFLRELRNVYIDELRFTRAVRYAPTLTSIPVQSAGWPTS
jgi:hypothetical protein